MPTGVLTAGKQVHVSAIGASISAGQGVGGAYSYPKYVAMWLQDAFPNQTTVINGAIGGTLSSYMAACVNMHVSPDADLVLVEYNLNDLEHIRPPFMNDMRRSYERLIRKLLSYPKRPAVVLVHSFKWFNTQPFQGVYWHSAEHEMQVLANYYGLPSVSVRACCYHLMRRGVEGFRVDAPRNSDPEGLRGRAWYHDYIHPDGWTGYRGMGEMVIWLLKKVLADLQVNPLSGGERQDAAVEVPPPMIPHNYQAASDRCLLADKFTSAVTAKQGFEWINEAKDGRPKWGFIGRQPGSFIRLQLNTTAAVNTTAAAAAAQHNDKVLVQIAHLKSYEQMGRASVKCVQGCTCEPSELEGHTEQRNSQLHLHNFLATQDDACAVLITILASSSQPNQHKVKIAGVIVSEEPGVRTAIQNQGAVEYVHDIASRARQGEKGVFNVHNHALL